MGTALMSNDSASCPYEIGDGFWTKNPTPPSERWPGTTWEQIKDMFLLSSGDTYSSGQAGGEAAHALNIAELPNIRTNILDSEADTSGFLVPDDSFFALAGRATAGKRYWWSKSMGSEGTENQPHNNMPPYIVRRY